MKYYTRRWLLLAITVAVAVPIGIVLSQVGYDWMPRGGQQLLNAVLTDCATCDELPTIAMMEKTQEEWMEYFSAQQSKRDDLPEEELTKGAFAGFADREVDTLVAYMAINLPIPEARVPEVERVGTGALPIEGRQLALEQCTACHAIAATMTQEWTVERWIHLITDGTHGVLRLTDEQVRELAHYITNNPVPMEEIPPPLREPMPGY